jgi:uncharacterized protein (DUF1501 family)
MKKHIHQLSRRKFLGQASCAAVGCTTFYSTLFNLKALNTLTGFDSAVTSAGDYKALVCILNAGGADAFNMLIPRDNASHAEYAVTRSNLAIPVNTLLPISPLNAPPGKLYGLHPSMTHMTSLFNSGKLAFINNVGSLIQPITKQQYSDGTVPVPLGLYSHADQIMHWQTGVPHGRVAQGWAGKMADLMMAANENQTISMNISLSGSNLFQTGNNSVEFSLDPFEGSRGIIGYNGDWLINDIRTAAINDMVNATYQNVFKKTYTKVIRTAIDGNQMFTDALANAPTFSTAFDEDSELSMALCMVAKTIAARQQLQMSRQIFFIEYGGWDHHDELLDNQAAKLTELDNALHSFNAALEQLNISNNVTTFSLSEFSRTLTSNGNGTDHAWGGNVFVMGGAVNGQRFFGDYPSLQLNNPLEIGSGALIPTTSADEYFAELALWYGLPASELLTLFPNLGYFYTPGSPANPLGFLNA